MFEFSAENGTMRMYGDVGDYFEGGISERDVMSALDAMEGKDLTVSLKSDGGDVFQGLSVFNQLNQYSGNVTIVIDSLAASIASVIAMAGDEVAIHEGSFLMIHNPWTVAVGDAKEFRGVANVLEMIGGEIAGIYAAKSGQSAESFLDLMESDTYITSAEALSMGLADRVIPISGEAKPKAEQVSQPVASAAAFSRRNSAELSARLARVRRRA